MTPTEVFLNGNILTDSGVIRDGMMLAGGGRLLYAGERRDDLIPERAERIDAEGRYFAPGFVDIHIHGGAGSDFMDANPGDIETVFRYHAAHGTTAMCPTTTRPWAPCWSDGRVGERGS